MRKLAAFFLCFVLVFAAVSPIERAEAANYTPNFTLDAKAVYMVNLETEMVMYEYNAHQRVYPASLTKIMTAILTIEMIEDLDNTMIELKAYVEDTIYRANLEAGGALSLSGILRGEQLSAKNLLYAIMLPSGNEAAMMLGDYIGDGSMDYFCELMNNRAKELGAVNTNFVNANGLHDDNHYTTAYDLYLIAKHAMTLPNFMDIVNTLSHDGGPTNKHDHLYWQNTNRMLDRTNTQYYYPYINGIKTGSTPEAGRCLISTASRDGYNYMLVFLGAPYYEADGTATSVNAAFTQTKSLYQWAFETFKVKTLIERGKGMGEVPLRYASNKDHLLVMSGDRYSTLLPNEIEASSVIIELDLPHAVAAPVQRGDQIGEIVLILAGEEIGRVPAVAAEGVEASTLALFFKSVNEVLGNFWVKFAIIFVVLLILGYILLMVLRNRNKRKYDTVRRHRKL